MLTVFRNKLCTVEITDPAFCGSGFRKTESGEVEAVFFDKGGRERSPREAGSQFGESQPGWVNLQELNRRKAGRCRAWKYSAEGKKDYLDRRERNQRRAIDEDLDGRESSYVSCRGPSPYAC